MAKSAAKRKQEQRERETLAEEERLAKLLAYRLTLDVFKGSAALLDQHVERAGLDGDDARHDVLTRFIHNGAVLAEQYPEAYQVLIAAL